MVGRPGLYLPTDRGRENACVGPWSPHLVRYLFTISPSSLQTRLHAVEGQWCLQASWNFSIEALIRQQSTLRTEISLRSQFIVEIHVEVAFHALSMLPEFCLVYFAPLRHAGWLASSPRHPAAPAFPRQQPAEGPRHRQSRSHAGLPSQPGTPPSSGSRLY